MSSIETDCRTEVGITVGLIDALISICRVLAKRDLSSHEVLQSLVDFGSDEDFQRIVFATTHSLIERIGSG